MRSRVAALLVLVLCAGCAQHAAPPAQGTQSQSQASVGAPKPQPPPSESKRHKTLNRAPASTETASSSDPEAIWFNELKNGMLKQYVPPTMQWKVASTVTVVVGGEQADTSTALPNANGSAAIKVARQMRVLVFSPDSPDEFTIQPEPGTQEVQFVPEQGVTTWNYSVTPRFTGKGKKIAIRAWVIYPGAQQVQQELPVYTAIVDVHVPSLGECLKRLVEGDPDYWLKYGLPGGAGFAFLSGAVAGLWKWLRRKKAGAGTPAPAGK